MLPALFAWVAPPGAANIPMTIGAITLAVTAIAVHDLTVGQGYAFGDVAYSQLLLDLAD
jgi:hypothetical protein